MSWFLASREVLYVNLVSEQLPAWLPLLKGTLTLITACSANLLLKYMTIKEKGIGFKVERVSMLAIFTVNLFILISAAFYWCIHGFNLRLFTIGFVGSIFYTLGITLMNSAMSRGPMGPVISICAFGNIIVIILFVCEVRSHH